jgi:hypothetical protein
MDNDNGVEEFCASRENRNREEMEMEKESGMGVICPMRSAEREI